MLRRYRRTELYSLFNLGDEKAKGRTVMLASSVLVSVINWMTGSLFYTGFLMANGIDLVRIGVISFVPYIANCFSIFCPSILERFRKRRWVLFYGRLAYHTLNILAVTVMPMLVKGASARTAWFAALVFAANIVNALFSGYTAWHLNFIPDSIRAAYFSVSGMISNFVGLGMGLVSALVADAFASSPHYYGIIVGLRFVAYALALVELWALTRPVEYPYPQSADRVRFTDIFTKPIAHPPFLRAMLVVAVWTFFVNTSAASLNYYLLNDVGVSYTYANFMNVLYPFVMLLLLKKARRAIERLGWFRTFAASALAYSVPCLLTSFVTAGNYLWLFTAIRLLQHVVGVTLNTAWSNLPFANMPDTDRTDYLAFHTLLANAAAFLGMLFGTWFAGRFPGLSLTLFGLHFGCIQVLMWIESLGRAGTALLARAMLPRLEPPRE